MFANISIAEFDPEIAQAITQEDARQEAHIELIASENYCSPAVMEAQGSKLTNKYAEGYPGKRYYGGCEYVDVIEQLAIDRAKELFGADYANVQPHAGSQANSAVYLALLNPGDTVLGMSLAHGGHLTHGAKVSFSGKTYNAIQYGLNPETGEIDYEEVERLAIEHKPRMIVAGFSAYSQIVDWQRFRDIADKVGAYLFVDMAHVAGLVAAGVYPSPVQIADVTTTTTHKTLRGPRSALIFSKIDTRNLPAKIDKAVFPGIQGGPHMNQIAAVAVALKEASEPKFKTYTKQVILNAKAFAKEFQKHGWRIVTGGTDSHLLLLDTWMSGKGISGDAASVALEKEGIVVNKNTIPGETRSPMDPSGLRLGTAAQTTRGWKEKDFEKLAARIDTILRKEISGLQKV